LTKTTLISELDALVMGIVETFKCTSEVGLILIDKRGKE
jgi:hypothetical protein